MSILLCPIYKLNRWFSGVTHPVKIILSISQQLRVVIAPGPQFPSSVFTERKRPVPSTTSLRAQCKERNHLETCCILTAIFLLQAKSPIRSMAPKWQSLQKSPLEMWNKSSAAGVKGGAVNWASDTEQEAVLPCSALLEPEAGHLHLCVQEISSDLFQHLFPLCFGIEKRISVRSCQKHRHILI